MKQLYFAESDLFHILLRELPARLNQGIEKDEQDPNPQFDPELFSKFGEQYQRILITSGLPHGDYGQTLTLYALDDGALPKLDDLTQHVVTSHQHKQMPVKYHFATSVRTNPSGIVIRNEKFFFEHVSGSKPTTFSELFWFGSVLRHYSSIMYNLTMIEIVMLNSGIYVELECRESNHEKPAFTMAW